MEQYTTYSQGLVMFGALPANIVRLLPAYRKAFIAAACTIPADCLFAFSLYLIYPDSFLPALLFIVNFSLVLLALLGINSRFSSMILPAVVWKCLLLLFLLFIGCISIDAFQTQPVSENFEIAEDDLTDTVHISKSVAVWRQLSTKYPLLPFFAIACTVILAVEARIFFSAWQKICCPVYSQDDADLEKNPPTYHQCVLPDNNNLPTYEDAIRAAQASSSTSPQQQQQQHHVIYVTSSSAQPPSIPAKFKIFTV